MRHRNIAWVLGLGLALTAVTGLWRAQTGDPSTAQAPTEGAATGAAGQGTVQPGVRAAAAPGPGSGATPNLGATAQSGTGALVSGAEGAAAALPVSAETRGMNREQAAAHALLLASFTSTDTEAGPQPAPVDLRRDQRRSPPPPAVTAPVRPADVGLPAYPGAFPMREQSVRDGAMVSYAATAFASFKAVRSFYSAQVQPSADGQRQVTLLADTDNAFDARIVDLQARTVQRIQLAAGETFVAIQLSRVDVQ